MRGYGNERKKVVNLTWAIMSKYRQYPDTNRNLKAHEISHVCFQRSVRYFCSPAGLLLSHFWEVQLVEYTAKTLKHSGKSTQSATKSREKKVIPMPRLIFFSLSVSLSLCLPPSGRTWKGLQFTGASKHYSVSLLWYLWDAGWMVYWANGASIQGPLTMGGVGKEWGPRWSEAPEYGAKNHKFKIFVWM